MSEGIGTDWLLTDNGLTAYCRDFPTTGTLWFINTCDVYTVAASDTCSSTAKAHNIRGAATRVEPGKSPISPLEVPAFIPDDITDLAML